MSDRNNSERAGRKSSCDDGPAPGRGPIRFRVYAVLAQRGGEPRFVEVGAARDAESAFEFAWLVKPGQDGDVQGVRIVESGGRVWVLGECRDAPRDAQQVMRRHIRALPRRPGRGERRRDGRDLHRKRDGQIDWSSFGAGGSE